MPDDGVVTENEWFEQEPTDRKAAWIRQDKLTYGGLIAIGAIILQPFLTASSLNWSALTAVIAFAVGLPHLAILLLIDDWPISDRYPTSGLLPQIAKNVGIGSACIGVVAAFWHISWIAGVVVLVSGISAFTAYAAWQTRLVEPSP